MCLETAVDDILAERGHLFLGSRLKRLAERMQGDVLTIIEREDLPLQPSLYPLLAALDRDGPMTVSDMVRVTGVSQPAVTRSLARLTGMGFIETKRVHRDQRHKTVALTEAGVAALEVSKTRVWPGVEAAVMELCAGVSGTLLEQISAIEAALETRSLAERAAAARAAAVAGLRIVPFSDEMAGVFHDINVEWIGAMFKVEATDREVLENPQARIIAPGGDILFVEAAGLGIVGACALQKTGEGQFELTKMGVRESARGRKAGEFLLRAVLRRAEEMQVRTLYLLTNSACGAAIHLYEKLGFVHDAGIMRDFGGRYRRCDVAMVWKGW
jgi:DNA-binding MarR family transcriptional regulator/GNAT superfamily N-acetyltransferase